MIEVTKMLTYEDEGGDVLTVEVRGTEYVVIKTRGGVEVYVGLADVPDLADALKSLVS